MGSSSNLGLSYDLEERSHCLSSLVLGWGEGGGVLRPFWKSDDFKSTFQGIGRLANPLALKCGVHLLPTLTGVRNYQLRSLKGPIHPKLNCAVYLCKKTVRKTELNVLWHSTGFPSGLSVFLSVLWVFLCV